MTNLFSHSSSLPSAKASGRKQGEEPAHTSEKDPGVSDLIMPKYKRKDDFQK